MSAESVLSFPTDIRQSTDEQLTALTSHWAQLDPAQRRKLLAEVRSRMHKQRSRNSSLMERFADAKNRQYGGRQRVIREVRKTRQPDGSILVETRVVRLGPKSTAPIPTTSITKETAVSGDTQGQSEYSHQQKVNSQRLPHKARTRTRVTFGIGFERRQQGKPSISSPQQPAAQAENKPAP